MHSRRSFLRTTGLAASAFSMGPVSGAIHESVLASLSRQSHSAPAGSLLTDERFWSEVRLMFTVSPNIINLNNGGVSPQPKVVQDAHVRNYQYSNEGPSYYMWRILDQGRESLRMKLAQLAGCLPDEVAINRNSTEGLNSIIFGLNLKAGDEVVLSKYDYPNMMNAWKQREKRDGIRLRWIDLELPEEDEGEIVKKYADAITAQTRVVHITHVVNWTGQVMPVRKIADMAHERGCEVIVDGAHSFAHVRHAIPDTGADYYATSLHKWLCAPFGSGLLYIRKDKIRNVWALLSNDVPDGEDIRKFESLGTRSFASEMAIGQAVDFHLAIGPELFAERMLYLRNYWTSRVKDLPGVKIISPSNNLLSCGIGHIQVSGWTGPQIEQFLFSGYKIHSVAIVYEALNGVRITPHVYTSLQDLGRLVEGITSLVSSEPPAP